MKRDDRDLEAEPHHQQDHRQDKSWVVEPTGADRCGYGRETGAAGYAEEERDPIEQDAGREGAQHEILGRGLERASLESLESGEHIEGEGHQLGA